MKYIYIYGNKIGGEIGVLHDIISKCLKRSGEDLLRLFRRYDDRSRGVVKSTELVKVLDRIDCQLKPSELDQLTDRYAYKPGEVPRRNIHTLMSLHTSFYILSFKKKKIKKKS